jgi:hypothetical protein
MSFYYRYSLLYLHILLQGLASTYLSLALLVFSPINPLPPVNYNISRNRRYDLKEGSTASKSFLKQQWSNNNKQQIKV